MRLQPTFLANICAVWILTSKHFPFSSPFHSAGCIIINSNSPPYLSALAFQVRSDSNNFSPGTPGQAGFVYCPSANFSPCDTTFQSLAVSKPWKPALSSSSLQGETISPFLCLWSIFSSPLSKHWPLQLQFGLWGPLLVHHSAQTCI